MTKSEIAALIAQSVSASVNAAFGRTAPPAPVPVPAPIAFQQTAPVPTAAPAVADDVKAKRLAGLEKARARAAEVRAEKAAAKAAGVILTPPAKAAPVAAPVAVVEKPAKAQKQAWSVKPHVTKKGVAGFIVSVGPLTAWVKAGDTAKINEIVAAFNLVRTGEVNAIVAAMRGWPSYLPHSAAKGAQRALVSGLARALAPRHRINVVHPGTVLPPDEVDQDALERIVTRIPLGRIGSPTDITGAVRYLLNADYLTGTELVVDGGRMAQ
jgi:hypothetical protein